MARVDRALAGLRAAAAAAREALRRGTGPGPVVVPHLSAWSTLEHLHHLSLVNEAALERAAALLRGEDGPRRSGGRRTALGAILLTLGWIPRGRARAPEGLRPAAAPSALAIEALLGALETAVRELEARAGELAASRLRRHHFVFGDLNAAEWLRFAAIHSWHHLRIVRDIEAAARR